VKDMRVRNVQVYRYRWGEGKRTVRHSPAGDRNTDQPERLWLFAIVLGSLGLSPRACRLIGSGLKVMVSFMTLGGNVQEAAKSIQKRNHWQPVRGWGLEGAYGWGWGNKQPGRGAVDLGTGEPMAVGSIHEYDPHAIRRWLAPVVQRHGITVIVTVLRSSRRNSNLDIRFASSMFGAGWAGHANSYRKLSLRPGYGSWKKFDNSSNFCHPMAARAYLPSGNNYPVGVGTVARFAPGPEPGLAKFRYGSSETGDPLVQPCHRACDWASENARPHPAGRSLLTRLAFPTPGGSWFHPLAPARSTISLR
jgi:hypothetical protein